MKRTRRSSFSRATARSRTNAVTSDLKSEALARDEHSPRALLEAHPRLLDIGDLDDKLSDVPRVNEALRVPAARLPCPRGSIQARCGRTLAPWASLGSMPSGGRRSGCMP